MSSELMVFLTGVASEVYKWIPAICVVVIMAILFRVKVQTLEERLEKLEGKTKSKSKK